MLHQTLGLIFIFSFLMNAVWEKLHAQLYVHYKGGLITNTLLMRAACFDAVFITLLAIPFLIFDFFQNQIWIMITIVVLFAILLERWALKRNRWEYKPAMPIIPLIKTGLTPTIQLGLIALISFWISLIIL